MDGVLWVFIDPLTAGVLVAVLLLQRIRAQWYGTWRLGYPAMRSP
jgi:hypothetical protein